MVLLLSLRAFSIGDRSTPLVLCGHIAASLLPLPFPPLAPSSRLLALWLQGHQALWGVSSLFVRGLGGGKGEKGHLERGFWRALEGRKGEQAASGFAAF